MRINKERFRIAAIVFAILIAMVSVLATLFLIGLTGHKIVKNSDLTKDRRVNDDYGDLYELNNIIGKYYLYDVNKASEDEALKKALIESLGDDYSEYMTAKEVEDWKKALENGYTGIGVTIGQDDGNFVITSVAEDGPAEKAGIVKDDIISTVNGKSYDKRSKLLDALKGKDGDEIKLTLVRNGEGLETSVLISTVTNRQVSSEMLDDNIGYIKITTFGEDSAKDFGAELTDLENKGANVLIIDLRGNGGGYMDQGIKVADAILPECTITYMENNKKKKKYYNSDENATKLKYALLVNSETASTAEIVAAAVKDNKTGSIIGETTFGKGTVQREFDFNDGSMLKLTAYEYFSPNGNKIHGKGVTPDYEVESDGVLSASPGDNDPAISKAHEVLRQSTQTN